MLRKSRAFHIPFRLAEFDLTIRLNVIDFAAVDVVRDPLSAVGLRSVHISDDNHDSFETHPCGQPYRFPFFAPSHHVLQI